jgi:hypothetical protein
MVEDPPPPVLLGLPAGPSRRIAASARFQTICRAKRSQGKSSDAPIVPPRSLARIAAAAVKDPRSEAILVRDRGELSNHADLEAEKIGQDWCQALEGDALGERR